MNYNASVNLVIMETYWKMFVFLPRLNTDINSNRYLQTHIDTCRRKSNESLKWKTGVKSKLKCLFQVLNVDINDFSACRMELLGN